MKVHTGSNPVLTTETNNMEQQTAVDWLVEQLQAPCRGIPSHIIEQAKQIQRKQIIQSFRIGKQNGYESGTSENFRNLTAEEYYKELYSDQL